jgi:glycosyltransferase involved in cell wall biosynthesis
MLASPVPEAGQLFMRPSISVVIPYFNGSRFIGEALATVHAQTYAPREIIVVDDGSRPEEAAALDLHAGRCTVIHLPRNRGPSVARNVGVARAAGDWIAFLDCDDLWAPNKLEAQVAYVESHPGCRAVHTGIRAQLADGSEAVTPKSAVVFDDFLQFPCPIFPSAVLIERMALFECGLFDPTKRCCEDLDLFLRFCYQDTFHAIPEPLVTRRVQPDGLSRNVATFWREADRVYRNYRSVFADRDASRRTLIDLHADFALRSLYQRDFGLLWRMLRRATARDVPLYALVPRVLAALVRNRWRRRARA